MKEWTKKHGLILYFILAFAWSWVFWFGQVISMPPDAFLSGNLPPTFIIFALVGGFGPTISALIVSRIQGREEQKQLTSGLKKGKIGLWYLPALLTVPLLVVAQAGMGALTGRTVTYSVAGTMLVLGFIWPVFSALGEEIGWRGFALPRMQSRFGILSASLILGVIWGCWHAPADYIAYSSYGPLFIPMFILLGPLALTAHSVIMTFIYNRTGGSLIAMILYHYTITGAGILSPAVSSSGPADDVAKTAVTVAVLWVAAILVIVFSKTMRNAKQPELQKSTL